MKRDLTAEQDDLVMIAGDALSRLNGSRTGTAYSEFIHFLLGQPVPQVPETRDFVGKDEFYRFGREVKGLFIRAADLFRGAELVSQPQEDSFADFCRKLRSLQ